MNVRIRPVAPEDADGVVRLVEKVGLPTGGLASLVREGRVLVATDAGVIIGCVAAESTGHQQLVRSLAVSPDRQGEGIGHQLLTGLLETIAGDEVWTLTETAEGFLTRHGFTPVDRAEVTGPVTDTEMWSQLCPDAAIALRLAAAPA